MPKIKLETTVDTNDADWETSVQDVSKEELDRFISILGRIVAKKGTRHNWENDSSCKDIHEEMYPEIPIEDLEFLSDYLPCPEDGFHSIVDAKYYIVSEEVQIIND